MKRAYYYSEKQHDTMARIMETYTLPKAPNGYIFTEQVCLGDDDPVPKKNNFADSDVVCVQENLEPDEHFIKHGSARFIRNQDS